MTEPNEQLIPLILSAAIASAGPRGSNEGQWLAKINDAIAPVAAMMHDGTRQWHIATEVLGAAVFVGTYVSHEVEESSTRVILRIDTGKATKNYPDGVEPIRTHRTDGAQGRSMKERLDRLEVGDEIVVWKALEANDDGTEKYRVLVHFTQRPKRQSSGESVAPAPPVKERVESQEAPPPPATPRSESLTDATNSKRLQMWRTGARESLTNTEFEELVQILTDGGYSFEHVSEVEWDAVVRPFIRQIIHERNQ